MNTDKHGFFKSLSSVLLVCLGGLFLCAVLLLPLAAAAQRIAAGGTSYLPLLLRGWPAYPPGRLAITEVLYDPDGTEPGGEWIEIYHTGGGLVDLSAYKLGDEETLGEQEGMFQFPAGDPIAPGQVIVVAYHAAAYLSLYGHNPDFELRESDPQVPDMVRYSAWAGGNVELGNSGDEVVLLDGGDRVVDALCWGNAASIFDPPVPAVPGGHSLERYPAGRDTDSAEDWRDLEVPDPGQVAFSQTTPTAQATYIPQPTPAPADLVINEIHADPDSQAGDANGDGTADSADDEFVEIVNAAGTALDLGGCSLSDGVDVRHIFQPGTILPAGCAVVIFAGGEPSGGFGMSLVQAASQGRLGLNNDGDTITLLDSNSKVVSAYTYGTEGGKDQSLTRDPDIVGLDPLVLHASASASGGALYSPGTQMDGVQFAGCPGFFGLFRHDR